MSAEGQVKTMHRYMQLALRQALRQALPSDAAANTLTNNRTQADLLYQVDLTVLEERTGRHLHLTLQVRHVFHC